MIFNSLAFPFFLLFATAVVLSTAPEKRMISLLFMGVVFFFIVSPFGLLVLLVLSVLTFIAALSISKASGRSKTYLYGGSICFLTGTLLCVKYLQNFAVFNLISRIVQITPSSWFEIVLPIGLSFYTLQMIAYLTEIYIGKLDAEGNLVTVLTYFSFFPSVLAGPLNRPADLIPQLKQSSAVSISHLSRGVFRVAVGLMKKIVIADNLSLFVTAVFDDPHRVTGWRLLIAIYAYSFQIYYDFSGYTDIAIGCASLMGITLPENFNKPYLAISIIDFWKRWHITLTSWFREYILPALEYLYIFLGGENLSRSRVMINVIIVFLISGMWHGNTVNYLLWGGCHGLSICLVFSIRPYWSKLEPVLSIIPHFIRMAVSITVTFTLVSFLWIFFRVQGGGEVVEVFCRVFQCHASTVSTMSYSALAIAFIATCAIAISTRLINSCVKVVNVRRIVIVYLLVAFMFAIIFYLWGRFSAESFIYFRF
ncbi:MAG: hypothetical protein LWX56_12525 [Ignavibacteria bacterium]|nr:hypothetical protein [Ignavibacteria bacterium]